MKKPSLYHKLIQEEMVPALSLMVRQINKCCATLALYYYGVSPLTVAIVMMQSQAHIAERQKIGCRK